MRRRSSGDKKGSGERLIVLLPPRLGVGLERGLERGLGPVMVATVSRSSEFCPPMLTTMPLMLKIAAVMAAAVAVI